MCVVSMITDSKIDDWQRRYWPAAPMAPLPFVPSMFPEPAPLQLDLTHPLPTRQEIEEFYRLLERAREYDRRNNEPECPEDEKRTLLQQMAKQLGVEISFP